MNSKNINWDEDLPETYRSKWDSWRTSLHSLNNIQLERPFYPLGFSPTYQDLHIFCDASDQAIGYVAYMRSLGADSSVKVSFVTGSSKVSPRSATSIPRLELCAAVEAAKRSQSLNQDLKIKPSKTTLYTDSRIVLGYINNTAKRFSKYVERRVALILQHSNIEDWQYINTADNPADIASRPCSNINALINSIWLTGPNQLHQLNQPSEAIETPNCELPEEKKVTVLKVEVSESESPLKSLFHRISSWNKLVSVIKIILHFIRKTDTYRQKSGTALAPRSIEVSNQEAIEYIVRHAQQEAYPTILKQLSSGQPIHQSTKISELSPYMCNGIIVVGGRLKNSNLAFHVKHPMLIPKDHPISLLICRHYHEEAKHQGGHISHGYINQAGFHIENGRQLTRKYISECIICKKLRKLPLDQFMADLPKDRVAETKPFEHIGIDAFGPFFIHEGKSTRRTNSSKKVWVLIFVCLPSRAVHLEPLNGMDTSSFRNALTRFIAIRGPIKKIRSDRGTNFTSSKNQMEEFDTEQISKELEVQGIKWDMNVPHASHHGGSWERKIGSVRRILEASMALASNRGLNRDEFNTYIAEASSVVNNTPLWATSSDPNDPTPLTPSMLLTLRENTDVGLEEFKPKDLLSYGTRRYRRVQYLVDQFWIRWQSEYLQTLTRRHKWKRLKPCISPGDIVLLREKQSPRNQWPMARVESVKTSDDNLVRSVSISVLKPGSTFQRKHFDRPITELILLIPSSNHGCSYPVS